ncbi:MAG: hypothetical protein LBS77_01345 [Desulfovibrio sp.]|nr:hypothetical protein [Desulfovibrio sp.]
MVQGRWIFEDTRLLRHYLLWGILFWAKYGVPSGLMRPRRCQSRRF